MVPDDVSVWALIGPSPNGTSVMTWLILMLGRLAGGSERPLNSSRILRASSTHSSDRKGCGTCSSGDRDLGIQVHTLDGLEQLDTLVGRPLERLAPADEAGAAGPLVDDRGA